MWFTAGQVVHTYNPDPWGIEAEGCKFEVSLGYIGRLCLKKQKQTGFTVNKPV
jgi:hypothetical protein